MSDITYGIVTDLTHLKKIVAFQKIIWNDNATPLTHLVASCFHGGLVIYAELNEEIIGFCYGFPGFRNEEKYLVSHMLAIHSDYRNKGIGMFLKIKQREWALSKGYNKIVWTFDPLESRNGYLNLCKLGGFIRTYIENYYGTMDDSLNYGLPSDRFLLEWDLESSKTVSTLARNLPEINGSQQQYPVLFDVETVNDLPSPLNRSSIIESNVYLVPVPKSIQTIKIQDTKIAIKWRHKLRNEFNKLFADGYIVDGMVLNKKETYHYYILNKREDYRLPS